MKKKTHQTYLYFFLIGFVLCSLHKSAILLFVFDEKYDQPKTIPNLNPETTFNSEINFEICILTSMRPNNVSYVEKNLLALKKEGFNLNDVSVIDVDNSLQNKQLLKNQSINLPFINSIRKVIDCTNAIKNDLDKIPCQVQQSNYDVALALGLCESIAKNRNKKWILFIEDDMQACPGSYKKIQIELKKSNLCPIKFSKFSRAFAISVGQSTLNFVTRLQKLSETHPYDYVLWDNIWNENCNYIIYTSNLFHHIGQTSTVPYRNDKIYLETYAELRNDFCNERLS